MTINTADMKTIIEETTSGFNARVMQHYETLSDENLESLETTLLAILTPKVSDAAVQRRQYNPKTDVVEDI